MALSPYLYVPNIIGYVRVVTGIASFYFAFDSPGVAGALYAFSYWLDALDGVAARRLNQTSRFGAVLDMVTDRFCTAGILAVLSHLYPDARFALIALMILDIGSHWVQMYSTLLVGGESHKKLATSEPALLRFYYSFPYALFVICAASEGFLVALYCETFAADVRFSVAGLSFAQLMGTMKLATAPVFALKQLISVVQLGNACNKIVAFDVQSKKA